ncbi:MAG: collagen-binding domain-containing protein [Candidatus Acidiferrales bacterium]
MANQLTSCTTSRSARRTHGEPARRIHGERGVALFLSIFALLLLSGIAAALIFSSATDTAINGNYRSEEVAYFGAKSGIEEVRDRMMSSNPNFPIPVTYPTYMPTTPTSPQLYILNEGNHPGTVQPWTATNAYVDDELCHDGYTYAGLTSVASDLRCTTLPSAPGWYNTITSTAPWNGTAAALPYKWVRLGLKLNGSEQHYVADNNSLNAGNLVCWNGTAEQVLPTADVQNVASCSTAFAPGDTPVYLITSLGIAPNGARKVVQAEIALTPSAPSTYGFWANSSACPAITFSGNGTTDSYSTAGYTAANASAAYAATEAQTGGDIGSNGTVSMSGNSKVGGDIGGPNTSVGNCPAALKTSGNAGMVTGQTPPNQLVAVPATTLPTPPAANPLPPTTSKTYSSSASIVPGSYGNISVSGNATLTLAAGTYNINSLSVSGNGKVTITPSTGSIVLNIAGTGQGTVLTISGNGIANPSLLPSNVTVNYAGTGNIQVSGNGSYYAVLNAPNAAVTYSGNGAIYGAITANTITDSGNGALHFDRNTKSAPPSTGFFTMISYREVSY